MEFRDDLPDFLGPVPHFQQAGQDANLDDPFSEFDLVDEVCNLMHKGIIDQLLVRFPRLPVITELITPADQLN
jgi:hypothetical protein